MCEPSRPACLDRGGQKGETDMELGSWSIIQAPSLLALIPLVVMIVLIFRGKSNVSAIMVGVLVGALLLGQDLGAMAKAFATSLGSSTALIGLIIMMGAGLGVLMSEAGVTHTLVYWIVKRIGVNTQTKGKIALVVVSIIVCGLLGTLGGGNAVIAPIMLPIMASLGVTPTVVATLFKVAGEIGLILGPLTGVTLITMEVTGLSYGELMIQAAIPFAVFWLAGAWVGANRAQKRTFGKEGYALGEDVQHLDQVVITPPSEANHGRFPDLLCPSGGLRHRHQAGHQLRPDGHDRPGCRGGHLRRHRDRPLRGLHHQGRGLPGQHVPDLCEHRRAAQPGHPGRRL